MPIVGRFGSLAGLGSLILPGGAMEPIATVTVGSGGASSVSFSNIPTTYQHLQVRCLFANTAYNTLDDTTWRWNGATTVANYYTHHQLRGDGSAAAGNSFNPGVAFSYIGPHGNTNTHFTGLIVDILDYASTTKNKTIRSFGGYDTNGSGLIWLRSSLWMNTAAMTSMTVGVLSSTLAQHSTFALYGLRAP